MSSRLQTREASHFLVEFDDENANLRFYVCPKFKILIDGRIRIGEKYLAHWGDKDGDKDKATVLESGEWLDMRRKERECKKKLEQTTDSPNFFTESVETPPSSPVSDATLPSPIALTKPLKRKRNSKPKDVKWSKPEASLVDIEDGNNDTYLFKSPTPSPELLPHFIAPTSPIEEVEPEPEPECNGKDKSPVLKTRPAFSSNNDLAEILKQVEINNARSSLLERMLIKQQETIEKLFAFVTRHLQPQESENTQRISTARRSLIDPVENESDVPSPLPSHSSRLPDMPVTPTTSHISTREQRNTFSPAFGFNISTPPMRQTLIVPYSLFSDIPEQFLISENDLSRAIHSSKEPGNFACHIMPILFPELFTSDNLRTMYTFYGGGKLNKNPLSRQKREFLRRYVVTVYPEVMCDKAFNERVLSKVNQLLRRPIHRK